MYEALLLCKQTSPGDVMEIHSPCDSQYDQLCVLSKRHDEDLPCQTMVI